MRVSPRRSNERKGRKGRKREREANENEREKIKASSFRHEFLRNKPKFEAISPFFPPNTRVETIGKWDFDLSVSDAKLKKDAKRLAWLNGINLVGDEIKYPERRKMESRNARWTWTWTSRKEERGERKIHIVQKRSGIGKTDG